MTTPENKRKAVEGLASDIARGSNGRVSSEQAHKIAVETAQKNDRKKEGG